MTITHKDLFAPADVTRFPVAGSDATFPVRRVYCIGRNYAAHAIEMGHDPDREPPFFFQKNPDNITFGDFPYPPETSDVHFEIELVVALSKGGTNIPVDSALDHVFGYAVGLDMTRRDLQDEAKGLRRPWALAKGADFSGPIGPIHPASQVGHLASGEIVLEVDGAVRQKGDLADMIWSVAEQVSYLSRYNELFAGDVIFTGTPDGVGAVRRGETMRARIAGLGAIALTVV
jgi:fumarylpyruvate hydrolase